MILRVHGWEIIRANESPLPWFSDGPRAFFHRVVTGEPAAEMDENGEPTGWYLMAHPDINEWDLFMMDLWRAGWAFVDSLTEAERSYLVKLQHDTDWANFEQLSERIISGELTEAEGYQLVLQEIARQGETLGVEAPKKDDDEILDSVVRDVPRS